MIKKSENEKIKNNSPKMFMTKKNRKKLTKSLILKKK